MSTSYPNPYQQDSAGYPQGGYAQPGYTNYEPNPYGGQMGAVQPYSATGYVQPPEHPQATTVLILGIIGCFVAQICAPIAWYLGSKARKEMAENPGRYANSGTLTAGWVMGIIGTILLILGFIFGVIYLVIMVGLFGAITASGG